MFLRPALQFFLVHFQLTNLRQDAVGVSLRRQGAFQLRQRTPRGRVGFRFLEGLTVQPHRLVDPVDVANEVDGGFVPNGLFLLDLRFGRLSQLLHLLLNDGEPGEHFGLRSLFGELALLPLGVLGVES